MHRAVKHSHLDVDHRVAGEHALGHRVLDALVDGDDVGLGDLAADDLVLELVALTVVGIDAQPAVSELA